MIATAGFVLGRIATVLFCLATWTYGITTYSPFAFDMFVRPQLFAPLTTFVIWHHVFYWIAFLASAATLVPDIRHAQRASARWAAIGYVLVFGGVGVYLLGNPYLAGLDSASRAPWAVHGALLPLLWLAVVDHLSARGTFGQRDDAATTQGQLIRACGATAAALWFGHAVTAAIRGRLLDDPAAVVTTLAWALTLNVTALLVTYAVATFAVSIASAMQRRFAWEFGLITAFAAIAITELWRRIVLPAFSFAPADAALIALGLGLAIAASWSGLRLRLHPRDARSAIDVLIAIPIGRAWVAVPSVAVICAAAAMLTATIEPIDWAYLLHAAIALSEAVLVFGIFLARFRHAAATTWSWRIAIAPPLLAIVALHSLPPLQTRLAALTEDAQLDPRVVLDRLASTDPLASFAADRFIELPAFDLEYFQEVLATETAQPTLDPAVPARVAGVGPVSGRPAVQPNVFVFVIDSLRRDYLSPYNAEVTFTPAIDAWARDSFVFKNAFTPYGGTWLAIPSLWAGGPVPRGWARILGEINALETGVTAAGYDFVINDFTVADQLRATRKTFLDPSIPSKDTDLCRNVESLQAHLSTRTGAAPVFAFLAPMNVHILNTGMNSSEGRGQYPGFYPPYASRLERLDRCFGAFIEDLKRRGMYDDSVIVLTSDHGDALGGEGRWGHQYYLFPETIRIPLIVHLPRRSSAALTTDLSRITLLTDVAPTILDAIGEPFAARDGSGSPLFVAADGEPPQRRRNSQLLMSSYGSTYGLLRRNGRQLYISDLRNWREYAISLDREPFGRPIAITGSMRRVYQQQIREQVAAVQALYRR